MPVREKDFMKKPKFFNRMDRVKKIQGKLERHGFPRLQMFLLVALTGGAGFLASVSLHSAGLAEMWLRYLAALAVAYAVFLVLLWLWLRTDSSDYVDVGDFSFDTTSSGQPNSCYHGGGGDFGGGGASSSFGSSSDSSASEGIGDVVGEAAGFVPDADELAIPIILLVVVAAMLFSSLFIVYSAPVLFAELLVDGALSASLYRRLRGLESRHWLETAIRKTVAPFVMTAVVVSSCGYVMSLYVPEADSMGDVIRHLAENE